MFLCLLTQTSFSQALIIIDAGHGYNADCSNGDGRSSIEIDTDYEVAEKLKGLLDSTCGYDALLTRNSNACGSQISLAQRTMMANSWGGDAFLSIHCNALPGFNATGTETFWCQFAAQPDAEDEFYAGLIQIEMASHGQWNNRRVVEDDSYLNFHLSVLRNIDMYGALNEIGFVTSSDSVKLLSNAWRDEFALAYYDAITSFFNINCSTSLLDCSLAKPLNCGEWYQQDVSNAPSQVETYGCNNWSESGPERVHSFSLSSPTDVSVVIDNFSGDLDTYILSDCHQDSCVGTTYSQGSVAYDLPVGDYYVVVDSDDGSTSGYDISFQCGLGPDVSVTQLEAPSTIDFTTDSVTVYSKVFNLGTLEADSFWVYYYLSSDQVPEQTDYVFDSLFITNLLPTEYIERTLTVSTQQMPAGSYWVIAFADKKQTLNEVEEFNNIAMVPVSKIEQDLTTSVSVLAQSSLNLYPNPVVQKVFFDQLEQQQFPMQIKLINSMGQEVLNKQIYHKQEYLDVTQFSSGVYELRAITPLEQIAQKLVISTL